MASSIRSIRGIERSNAYAPIQAVSPYAYYPYRNSEPPLAPHVDMDWNSIYEQAASSAATWLQTAKQVQIDLEQLSWQLSRQFRAGAPIMESIHEIPGLLNHLELQYKLHSDDLIPELWESIEQALQHPAVKELGLRRNQEDSTWIVNSIHIQTFEQSNQMKRLLLGSDGIITRLKYALTFADYQKAADLVLPQLTTSLPYAAYYGSMQFYSPLPNVGLIFNRYL